MATSRRALDAGRAVITLSLQDKVSQELNQFQAKLAKVSASFQRIGMAGVGIASAIGGPLIAAVKIAADAREQLAKFKSVFAEQSDAADKFATSLAKSIGRSANDIRAGMNAFQGFFVGLGFGNEEARKFTEQLQTLSHDFAAFHNLDDQEAMDRMISALSGSSEVLDKFGVNTRQAALEQALLDRGIRKSWTAVTEQEKAVARLDVIMRAMTDQGAVGAAVRESGSLANQLKALSAQIRDTAAAVGESLMPVATDLVGEANEVAKRFSAWSSENLALITSTAKATVGLAAFSAAAVGVGTTVRALTATLGGLRIAITAIGSHPVIAGITAATTAMMALDQWVEKTYRNTERLGKKLADLGPPRPLTPEEESKGPYMLDMYGNAILDLSVADFYGDNQPDTKPKSNYSNGTGFGGERGTFSNGQTIGGANDPWDNPRSVPFANTPSIDPMQSANARLGLNQIDQNTSDPSGRAGAALLVMAWEGAMKKARESVEQVSIAVDRQFGPSIDRIKAASEAMNDWLKDRNDNGGGLSRREEATLDASYAQQKFGGQGREIELLQDIAKSNRKIADKRPGMWGVPG